MLIQTLSLMKMLPVDKFTHRIIHKSCCMIIKQERKIVDVIFCCNFFYFYFNELFIYFIKFLNKIKIFLTLKSSLNNAFFLSFYFLFVLRFKLSECFFHVLILSIDEIILLLELKCIFFNNLFFAIFIF